jgi:hypothetical protein
MNGCISCCLGLGPHGGRELFGEVSTSQLGGRLEKLCLFAVADTKGQTHLAAKLLGPANS